MKNGKKENLKVDRNRQRVIRNSEEVARFIKKEDLPLLTDKQRKIVEMRLKKMKIEDIAKKMGYTKQYISWAILCSINRVIRFKNK